MPSEYYLGDSTTVEFANGRLFLRAPSGVVCLQDETLRRFVEFLRKEGFVSVSSVSTQIWTLSS